MHADTRSAGENQQFKIVSSARLRGFYCHIVQLTVERTIQRALGVTAERLAFPSRGSPGVVFARHVAMYLAQVEGQLTLTETGALFGRDRRAVAYAVSQLEDRREADHHFDRGLEVFAQEVRAGVADAQTYQRLAEAQSTPALN